MGIVRPDAEPPIAGPSAWPSDLARIRRVLGLVAGAVVLAGVVAWVGGAGGAGSVGGGAGKASGVAERPARDGLRPGASWIATATVGEVAVYVLTSFGGDPDAVIGIHGNNDPSSIGRNVSHGCIRLPNDVVSRMAGLIPLGTPVEIRA
jgi:hypothetical protein